jgi:hypothetical protein
MYAVLLCLLGAYAWKLKTEREHRTLLYSDSFKSQRLLEEIVANGIESRASGISKKELSSEPTRFNQIRNQQAQRVLAFCQENVPFATETLRLFPLDALIYSARGDTVPAVRNTEILRHFQTITDSLRLWISADSLNATALDQFFSKKRLSDAALILEHGSNAEKDLVLSSLQLGMLAVSHDFLLQIDKQLPAFEEWVNSFMPTLVCKSSCIHAGAYFEADFFLSPYSSHSEDMQLLINGENVPFEHGIGRIQKIYSTSGLKKLSVEVSIQSIRLNRFEQHKKDFTFNICD